MLAGDGLYQQIIDAVPEMLFVVDVDLRLALWNRAFAQRVHGVGFCQELLGRELLEVAAFLPKKVRDDYRQVFHSGKSWSGSVDTRGSVVETHLIPIVEQGTVSKIVTIMRAASTGRQLETANRSRRASLDGLLTSTAGATITLDAEHRILEWNQAAVNLFGYGPQEAIGKDLDRLIASGNDETFAEATYLTQQVLRGNPVAPTETVRYHRDGRPQHVILAASPILRDGRITGMVGIYLDISERKQVEEDLVKSESQYRATLNAMADAIHVVDAELRIVLFNDFFGAWNKELGLETEAIGKTVQEVFPFLPDRVRDEYKEVLEKGRPHVSEGVTQIAGRELVTETRKIPVFDGDRVAQVITVVRDITERKRAEEERERLLAAEREQRLQAETLRRVAAGLISTLDPQQVLPFILAELARVVRYDSASIMLLSNGSLRLVAFRCPHPRRAPSTPAEVEALPHVQQVLQGGKPVIIGDTSTEPGWRHLPDSSYIRCWMGVPLVVQDTVIGLLNLNHEQPGFYTQDKAQLAVAYANQSATAIQIAKLFDDLQSSNTALALERALLSQRVAERTAALSKANAQLARAARLKDEFLANMSHELRTPLNAILGFAQVLQEEVYGPLGERQHRSVENMERSGRHLLTLINDILDVSKIEAGKMALELGPVSVEAICQASLQFIRQDAREKQIKVVYTAPDDSLPVQVDTVRADGRRLKQILVNLLSNAVKFTLEEGSIGLETAVDAEQESICFTVWDSGIGIAQEDMHRLFEPFVQVDSSLSRQYRGTGLGLSLAYRLVRLHGGGLRLESKIGEGSRFEVSLPWSRDLETDLDEDALGTGASHRAAQSQTILLAEAHEVSTGMAERSLQDRGYRVVVAGTGPEARQWVQEERPDLIVVDVRLPGLLGTEGISQLVETCPIPIIAVSDLSVPGDRERWLAMGASLFLTKPLNPGRLADVAEELLDTLPAEARAGQ